MSSTKFDIMTKKISITITWLLYIFILYLFVEFAAGFALDIYRKYQKGATDFSILEPEVTKELSVVQGNAKLNLYRWYSNLPNYRGEHVVTDNSGFRIDQKKLTKDKIVGMFGGSTTWSVITSQEGTIPNLLTGILPELQVLNFGVGGYSTGAEIMTFVEALRIYPQMKTAIFYDGVNELARGLEQIGQQNLSNSYNLIGAPLLEGKIYAMNKSFSGISLADSNLFYIYKKIKSRIKQNKTSVDQDERLSPIINRYFQNIKVLSGICLEYNIECIFSWQPSIYTVSKESLNEKEKEILINTPMSDYIRLTEMIFEDGRSKFYNIVNLTDSLNQKSPKNKYFYDWCHLNADGNALVAKAIASIFAINK